MPELHRNNLEFRVWGRYALFTDPITRIGGEKCSYHLPTYEALKGIAKSIYWKPTLVWVIDEVRVMKRVRTQTKGTKPLMMSGGNTLSIYTFLADVEYQVRAHFEFNLHREELAEDRNVAKHMAIARRALEVGGRQDIFLGVRDCQGYVEPAQFGGGASEYDNSGEVAYGMAFHSFDYPDETGVNMFRARFWMPTLVDGVIRFIRPEDCELVRDIRPMHRKDFVRGRNIREVAHEEIEAHL